jgi:hypothetical protein
MLKGYYLELEKMPLQNWLDCNKGNYTSTRIDKSIGKPKDDEKAWECLYNDFLDKIGLSHEQQELVELTLERAQLQLEYLETRKRFLLNRCNELTGKIEAIRSRIKESSESSDKKSVSSILNTLSRAQGFQLQIPKLTALAYLEMLKDYNNG